MNSDVDPAPRVACVLDASVLVARLRVAEPGYPESALALRRMVAGGARLLVPGLALAEVAAALARGVGDARLARQAVDDLERLPGLRIVAVDMRLGRIAATVALRQRLRGCDAVYVALAQVAQAVLVTLDRDQIERSPAGVVVRTPAEWMADTASG